MTWPVVWLPEADTELKSAIAWYPEISPELAARFARAVEKTVEAIAADPLHYALIQKDRRRAGVKQFPYGLYFIKELDRILVLACFHGKRNPRHWQTRKTNRY